MVQSNKRMMRRVFLMLVVTCALMSGAILHAYAGGSAEETQQSSIMTVSKDQSFATQAAPSAAVVYTVDVCPGDTLWNIAAAHMPEDGNIRSYINKIKKANGLKNSNIQIGQILVLP